MPALSVIAKPSSEKAAKQKANALECFLLLPIYAENYLFASYIPLICTLCPPDSSISDVVLQYSFK
jgi:hypothetical protein